MRYYILIVRPADGGALLLRDGDGWTLPNFAPRVTDVRRVGHINDEMRRQLGWDVFTLRCAQSRVSQDADGEGDNRRVYIAEPFSADAPSPANMCWAAQSELASVRFTTPEIGQAAAWLAEQTTGADDRRSAWQVPGWQAHASEWIHARLTELGLRVAAPLRQERAWALSCTMRVATSGGAAYFKATPPFMAHEGAVMQAVAERCPELLPPPLAIDARRGWLLMPDYGGEMLHESADIARWEEALGIYARAQARQAAHAGEWLALGCPDRGLARMVGLIDPLIASAERLLGGKPNGLSQAEIGGLRARAMRLKLMCARLAQYRLPHTLVHGDLGGNILINDEGYAFFDWTDVCVTHPFFDMATISGAYFDESALPQDADTDARLRDAYLIAWTGYAERERLLEAFEAAKPLGALHQAMSYMWILTNIAPDARAELEGGLAHWLRILLRLCG